MEKDILCKWKLLTPPKNEGDYMHIRNQGFSQNFTLTFHCSTVLKNQGGKQHKLPSTNE
jgi:hypothetical protein